MLHITRSADDIKRVVANLYTLNPFRVWSIEIKRHVEKRSLSQNALYHMWVGIIHEETGNDQMVIKQELKEMFLEPRMLKRFDGTEKPVWSTTWLTTAEFTAYLDKILAFAGSDLGLMLPLPADLGREAA